MPMKSEELSSRDTKTWRRSSMRLRSLMSRTKACQRPSGRMFELTSTGTSGSVLPLLGPLGFAHLSRHQQLGLDCLQPCGVFGRDDVEDRLPDQLVALVAERAGRRPGSRRSIGRRGRRQSMRPGRARWLLAAAPTIALVLVCALQIPVGLQQAEALAGHEDGHIDGDETVDTKQQ